MSILTRLKKLLAAPGSYAETEFGMEDIPFFLALLRACPPGSQITFDQSEPGSFVHAFRKWSHRSDPKSFEADYYTISDDFIALAQQLASRSALELYCHLGISSPDGRLLCASWDDFRVVKLADEIRERIPRHAT
jgi:hypothetical protein